MMTYTIVATKSGRVLGRDMDAATAAHLALTGRGQAYRLGFVPRLGWSLYLEGRTGAWEPSKYYSHEYTPVAAWADMAHDILARPPQGISVVVNEVKAA